MNRLAEASNDAPDGCRAVKNFRYDNDNDIVCKEKREWGSGTILFAPFSLLLRRHGSIREPASHSKTLFPSLSPRLLLL